MTDWTLHPRGLDGDGEADGRYAVQITGGEVTGWTPLTDNLVASIQEGTRIRVDATDPENPIVSLASEQYVLTTVVDGAPVLVWDPTTLTLVYMEVSLP